VNDHPTNNNPITSNRLLGGLPSNELERFFSRLEMVELKFGSCIYELGAKIMHVYFPNSGIISLLAGVEASSTLEVGIVGLEGMAGLPLFLGVKRTLSKAIVQGPGTAMRMSADDFVRECNNGGALPTALKRFTHSMIVQISQSAVCFRFHVIEMRLARWLLMTSDRTESNEFAMTQEFLSHMLGVRREAVNRAAMSLQRKMLIAYSRNNILIIDRQGLESTACKCYSIIRDEESDG
jgi:CRP-like cAMP-binding protein